MRKFFPNLTSALILTPAIFLIAFWILVLSNSQQFASAGIWNMVLWALLLSFGAAYSITLFVNEVLKSRNNE